MERHRTFSGVSWEATTGYCRAIRVGNHIYVSVDPQMLVEVEVDAVCLAEESYPIKFLSRSRRCHLSGLNETQSADFLHKSGIDHRI